MNGQEPYIAALEKIRRRRRRVIIAVPPWFLCFGGLVALAVAYQSNIAGALAFGEALAGYAVLAFMWVRVLSARCPRCGRCFFTKWYSTLGVLGSLCVHCGLRLPKRL
jgi:hypothetical protein